MRRLIIATAVALFCAGLAHAQNANANDQIVDQIVSVYRNETTLQAEQADRCAKILRWVLTEKIPDEFTAERNFRAISGNAVLLKFGCIDRYSGLVYQPPTEDGVSAHATPSAEVRLLGNTLLVRVRRFDGSAASSVKNGLAALSPGWEGTARRVWIDLENNLGGQVQDGAEFLKLFAPGPGATFVRAESKCPNLPAQQNAPSKGILAGKQYLISVDRWTASMSELVYATIHEDWYKGSAVSVSIGDYHHTYGKSLLVSTYSGLGISITCGHWFVPGLEDIQGKGFTSDHSLERNVCKDDDQCLLSKMDLVIGTSVSAAASAK